MYLLCRTKRLNRIHNPGLSRLHRWAILIASSLCVLAGGCAERPKTAPTDFQELTSFLYEHMLDEDPEELRLGVENMYLWLNTHSRSVQRGYTVKRLSREAIASTGKGGSNKVIGGATLTAHGHRVDMLSRALGVDNVRETNGDAYISYRRVYQGGIERAECFARRECDSLEGDSLSIAEWGGLIETKYNNRVEFRWVSTRYGAVMLSRSFMNAKPEISIDIIDVNQSYYLGVVFPPLNPAVLEEMIAGESVSESIEESMGESAGEESAGEETSGGETAGGETAPELTDEEYDARFEATELNVEVDEAVIPDATEWGASAFLQVNWIDVDYGLLPISEDRALEMLVESMIEVAVATEKWMDRTYQ